jgi:Cu+-exporting ATPase
MYRIISITTLAFAAVAIALSAAHAASPKSTETTITIDSEMCGNCVKRLKAALAEIEGVASVEGNVAAKTMTIKAKPRKSLSPKTLWEVIEKAGKKPVKLVGPSGTYTSKPKT